MKNYRTKLLIVFQLCAIALLTLFVAASASAQTSGAAAAQDGSIATPSVPDTVKVEEGNEVFLVGHATGTQNYVCLPSGSGVAYSLFTPEATLFDDKGGQIITHFFSLNPFEPGVIRATWQSSQDTSTVWAKATGTANSTDFPTFVRKGAIDWVRLDVKDIGPGALAGPTGGVKLVKTTFIQRINTVGGLAPSTGCSTSADIGNKAFRPYTADYVFYKAVGNDN
jgi:hypothetical protein